MEKIIRIAGLALIASVAVTVAGCTTEAGPYVTNISSDGKGDILVQKNTVLVNGFTGTVSTGPNPTQEVIRVVPEPQQQSK
jgi:hypothetical protein